LLTQGEWEAKYKPKGLYEASTAREKKFILGQNPRMVWTTTFVSGSDDEVMVQGLFIVAGCHMDNAVDSEGFYICDIPWVKEFEVAVIKVENECDDCDEDCLDEDGEECCFCHGEGFVWNYPESKEGLIRMLGKERASSELLLE
jgi:hypothetical protein